ncbi:MAG TPA: DNA gyrase C-terminal beta-propeller domain-containing protein, partial [Roseiflexaceae bacterium]|nr:DNA gyrase C-terminal beta-propeller domain-containing protein [Roseiflexaceae bacterium]
QRGQTARFHQAEVRPMGRPASGVIGINLDKKDRVVSMDLVQDGAALLVVTSNGVGKRTALDEYPIKGRATGGVITIKLRPKDEVAVARVVTDQTLLTLISEGGTVMRTRADEISQLGRLTQGVNVVSFGPGTRVGALSCEVPDEDEARSENVLISVNGDGVEA